MAQWGGRTVWHQNHLGSRISEGEIKGVTGICRSPSLIWGLVAQERIRATSGAKIPIQIFLQQEPGQTPYIAANNRDLNIMLMQTLALVMAAACAAGSGTAAEDRAVSCCRQFESRTARPLGLKRSRMGCA